MRIMWESVKVSAYLDPCYYANVQFLFLDFDRG